MKKNAQVALTFFIADAEFRPTPVVDPDAVPYFGNAVVAFAAICTLTI